MQNHLKSISLLANPILYRHPPPIEEERVRIYSSSSHLGNLLDLHLHPIKVRIEQTQSLAWLAHLLQRRRPHQNQYLFCNLRRRDPYFTPAQYVTLSTFFSSSETLQPQRIQSGI